MTKQFDDTQISMSFNGGQSVPVGTLKDLEALADKVAGTVKEAKDAVKATKRGAIPVDVYDTKTYKQAEKRLGKDVAKGLVEKTNDELKMVVAENELRKEELSDKLAANTEYAKAKDIVSTSKAALKDTMKDSNLVARLAKIVLKARK